MEVVVSHLRRDTKNSARFCLSYENTKTFYRYQSHSFTFLKSLSPLDVSLSEKN